MLNDARSLLSLGLLLAGGAAAVALLCVIFMYRDIIIHLGATPSTRHNALLLLVAVACAGTGAVLKSWTFPQYCQVAAACMVLGLGGAAAVSKLLKSDS